MLSSWNTQDWESRNNFYTFRSRCQEGFRPAGELSKSIQAERWAGGEGEWCRQPGRAPAGCSLPDFHGCTEHSVSLYHLVNLWHHQLLPGKHRNYRFGSWQLGVERKYLALLGVGKESWNKFQNSFELAQSWGKLIIPKQTTIAAKVPVWSVLRHLQKTSMGDQVQDL